MSRPRKHAAPRTDEAGFSLIELVVAMVILGAMSLAIIGVVLQSQAQSVINRNRIAAANLAAREIDIVRDEFSRSSTAPVTLANAGTVVNPHPLPAQAGGQPLKVDGTAYTVRRDVAWSVVGNGDSACNGGNLVTYPTLRVTVTVTWPGMGQVKPVVSNTQLAPRKDDGVQGNASFVAVRVSTATGAPNVGRTVQVFSTAETRSATTDASGCAVVQVNPGASGTNYTARVTDPGHVDISGATAPTKPVGLIERGKLANGVIFTYDRAATLQLRFVDAAGAQIPNGLLNGQNVTVVASEYAGSTGARTMPVTGGTMTLTGLWPTQYGAYLGATPPGTGYPSATAAAGSTITLDVPVAEATP
ncbi:type II secretion system GspH family protein [Cellulomonas fimi]|uniref:type II secretion system protein n=1 Tax=Cellulomonas fimi TaxID=1708 RepID=UPI00234CCFDB|nr:type II secretion system protein [Cellulomonas fimi]MDC7120801.1 type II secretion system GspH family protein [Cellulomonas fimi]